MQWLSPVFLAVQVISSLSIIVLVLLQQGKGADMGSSFGGGSAGSLFGAAGAANFLSRMTKWAAIIFFVSTGGLAYMAHHPAGKGLIDGGVMQGYQGSAVPSAGDAVPAVPGAAVPANPGAPAASSSAPASVPSAPAASSVPSAPAASQKPASEAATPATEPKAASSGSGAAADKPAEGGAGK
ncbi:preprotein translocase subunit SecG [Parapusillimonas granuli]|uniref:Protein-export membrane protein SecG n=1 Tax=Parapusillimonas granuli TaxID=380911 RepID=A0A853FWJ7_9BURK|nr:preprotein translocase subunit SecG [Parapusillimonas granuli]MBB5214866.1 preprotein translocase subunit SecG [Parapusillimonas granuli]MEB2399938.1 preprotein translocase subunit SecG [Alcaligenaceae bacterium]NYT49188.1 preprotein translocase subunit SecG [Parapusillimonas granuli]